MRKIFHVLILLSFVLFACKGKPQNKLPKIEITKYNIPNTSIRSITILNDSTMAFSGSNGLFGIRDFLGNKIFQKRIKYDTIYPEFRAIAATPKEIYLLSVANPALLYQYKKGNLKLVYKEENEKVFYDAMKFFDDLNGIAMGDPINHCLSVIKTSDGGNSWAKISCEKLPKVAEGEAAFAASNTNIAIIKNNVWIATGGKKARVFYASNKAENWKVATTPLIQGKNTTGIYSIDFYDEKNGIIAGGDYTNKYGKSINKAITTDGGKTWTPVSENLEPKYVSCVQYVPNSKGKKIVAVSTNGIFYSNNFGHTWQQISKSGFYSIRFASKNLAWLSGNNVIAKMKINY